MASRRERSSRRRDSKVVWSLPDQKNVPEGDFLPPRFQVEPSSEDVAGDVTTYFLHTEKRGIARYLPTSIRYYQKGFRGVLVTKASLVFDQGNAKVVGRLKGDRFEEAKRWANRTVLDDLQDEYVRRGGGTEKDRQRTAEKFFKAMRRRKELHEKVVQSEQEFEQASVEMVLRFGRQPIALDDGVTLDACSGPGDKVFWRSRSGK
jgi:hypothetical protein